MLHLMKHGADQETVSGLNLEDFDPYDPTHLFWDQIKQLGFVLRNLGSDSSLF
jgi:hypothetical protein